MPYVPRNRIEPKPFIPVYTQPQPSQLIKLEPQPILPEVPIEPLPEPEPEPESSEEK
jgi:hypothetical protein